MPDLLRDPRLRLLSLAAALATAIAAFALSGSLSADRVRDWVDGYGAAGPLVFIAVSASLTVVLFPGPLLAGASGLLFGTALGFPVSLTAAVLGACLAFSVSRWWAHDAVEQLAPPRVQALRAWIGRRGFLSVLYARITPGVPYSLVNYAAGLTPMRIASFAGATALGGAPRAFAYTALGGQFGDFSSWQTAVAVAVLVGVALLGLVLARREWRASRVPGAGAEPESALTAPEPGTGSSSPAARSAGRR